MSLLFNYRESNKKFQSMRAIILLLIISNPNVQSINLNWCISHTFHFDCQSNKLDLAFATVSPNIQLGYSMQLQSCKLDLVQF